MVERWTAICLNPFVQSEVEGRWPSLAEAFSGSVLGFALDKNEVVVIPECTKLGECKTRRLGKDWWDGEYLCRIDAPCVCSDDLPTQMGAK